MELEKRWVTVVDNTAGQYTLWECLITLLNVYGEAVSSEDRQQPRERLLEGVNIYQNLLTYNWSQEIEQAQVEWMQDWLDYLCQEFEVEIHEDFPGCYGYWEDAPAPRQAIKFKGQFHCPTCGAETQDNGWCSLCRVYTAGGGATLTCTRCKAKLNNEGYCPDPHCPYSELFES